MTYFNTHPLTQHIRAHGLDHFLEWSFCKATRGIEFPNLVLLKYDQTKSPMKAPLVEMCRGIVLDEDDDWRVVCYPYDKFWNYGDPLASKLDWSTALVQEKLDGSLVTLYPYRGTWRVATSGHPEAAGNVGRSSQTFAELFWETFRGLGYREPRLHPEFRANYMFELCSPANRIVVNQTTPRLVHHGTRVLDWNGSFSELPIQPNNTYGWECAKEYSFHRIEDVLAAAAETSGLESEGFVAVDLNWNRVKVKAPDYVRLHHLISDLSPRRMLAVVQAHEGDELLTYFPEYRDTYEELRASFESLCEAAERAYAELSSLESPREFGLAVAPLPYSAALFAARKGRVSSPTEWLRAHDPRRVLEMMEAVSR